MARDSSFPPAETSGSNHGSRPLFRPHRLLQRHEPTGPYFRQALISILTSLRLLPKPFLHFPNSRMTAYLRGPMTPRASRFLLFPIADLPSARVIPSLPVSSRSPCTPKFPAPSPMNLPNHIAL